MGSAPSRPRPNQNESSQPTVIPPQHSGPPSIGPYFFRQSHQQRPGPFNPVFYRPPNTPVNNGQLHGGYQPRPPPPGTQPYPGQVSIPADKSLLQTETIRNAVNVKKDRIILTPVAGNPDKLSVHFEFDASSPCVVTIFVCGREYVGSEDACRISSLKQPAVSGGHYEKGIGLKFPRVGDDSYREAIIDLKQYREDELRTVVDDMQWPLIIRLECMSEQGLQQGHSLSELTPGGPQKVWVQSQTTFATLHKNEEGQWEANKLKQKIMVNGISYELQSIYGMDQTDKKKEGRPTPVQTAEQEEERLCVICLVNERDTTVLPCRHMCMCHECAQELRKQTSKCPICREHVESLLYIRMKQAPKNAATPVDQSTVAAALEKLRIRDEKRETALADR